MDYQQAQEAYLDALLSDEIIRSSGLGRAALRSQVERSGIPVAFLKKLGLDAGELLPMNASLGGVRKATRAPVVVNEPPPRPKKCQCDGTGLVRVDVDLSDPRFGRAQLCRKCRGSYQRESIMETRRAQLRAEYPFYAGAIPAARVELTTEHFADTIKSPEVLKFAIDQLNLARHAAEAMAKRAPDAPPFLVLDGPNGNGKTTLARKVYLASWSRGDAAAWTTGGALRALGYTFTHEKGVSLQEAKFADLAMLDLLVIDEAHRALIGDEKMGRGQEALFALVDRRLAARLPTVLTSNGFADALRASGDGMAILSRLQGADSSWASLSAVPDARPYFKGVPYG